MKNNSINIVNFFCWVIVLIIIGTISYGGGYTQGRAKFNQEISLLQSAVADTQLSCSEILNPYIECMSEKIICEVKLIRLNESISHNK